jgi:TonB-linked SusC/RagA family outer membrane protein
VKKIVRFVMAALALVLLPTGLYAQGDGTITGVVTDQATQQPVPGAQVVVVGTQRGSMTDQDGRFSIAGVPPGSYDVRARRVGYAPGVQRVTVAAGATATATFALATSATTLDEVVVNAVTGQEQRRVEVGVNTGNINVADLNKGPITKFSDVLQGRVPGVTLQSAVGTSGGGQRIRIRGANSLSLSNEPLIYIDGVQASNSKGGYALGGQDYSRLNDINPDDIENIEVLKGPAASALYGSAAANGVVLITTRRGRAGSPVWRMYAEGAQMEDKNDYPLNYAALTTFVAGEPYYHIPFGGVLNIRSIVGPTAPYEICPNYQAGIPQGQTIGGRQRCSQDVLLSFDQFRDARTTPYQTGARGKVGLNVSGGGEALTYFISGDRERENGVLRPNNVTRTSVRTNINARMGSKVTGAVNASYIQSSTERISNDNSIFSPLINALLGTAEYLPGMESDTVGEAGGRLGSYFGYNTADQRKVTADQSLDRFIIGANVNFTPLSWLRLNGNGGLDYFGRFDRQTIRPNELPLAESYILGFRQATRSSNYLWTANGSGTGTFSLTPSIVSNTTVGGSYQRGLFQLNECYGEGIPAGTQSCAATTSKFAVDEEQTDQITVGVFGRQELAIADRLFLAVSVRGDNNSGLTQDEAQGLTYYPSFNASWVISREPFFPTLNVLSQLRLRAGWGQAGQRPGFGDAETFFAPLAIPVGGVEQPALILTRTGNTRLKVERTTEIEGGFDVGFLDDRITADFTAFRRIARDALISRPLPPSYGVTATVFQNLGRIRNWGTEMGLNANVLDIRRVRVDARLTATTLHSRIEALGENIAPIVFNRGRQQHREGFPTGAYFALPIKYNDADGNGLLTRAEVSVDSSKRLVVPDLINGGLDTLNTSYVGPLLPTNTQNFNLDVTLFGSFTVSTLFERRAGHKQLNETEYFRCRQQAGSAFHSQCGALSNPNASLEEQAAFIGAQFLSATPFGYIEDATFVKWRELSLRFGVPESIGARFPALSGASISLSGRNLKTWTDYSGLDPEINETGGGATFIQGEFNTQPPVRVYSIRFDFQLR